VETKVSHMCTTSFRKNAVHKCTYAHVHVCTCVVRPSARGNMAFSKTRQKEREKARASTSERETEGESFSKERQTEREGARTRGRERGREGDAREGEREGESERGRESLLKLFVGYVQGMASALYKQGSFGKTALYTQGSFAK